MGKSARVIMAAHVKCAVPDDPLYLPLFVGAALATGAGNEPDASFAKDNTGENISGMNRCFGSQTGLYWAWKNLDVDYIGLIHYRRYFAEGGRRKGQPFPGILTAETLGALTERYSVFVPKKRRYYIETIYSHYAHTMDPTHMDTVRGIVQEKTPDYLASFDRVMKRRWGYMFNMMILRRDLLDSYCSWLFGILFETEKRIGHDNMTEFENRYCGRISERLFNVWLDRALATGAVRPGEIRELRYVEQVRYAAKVRDFLKAKVFHTKYTASNA